MGIIEGEIAAAGSGGRAWRERVRGGLLAILWFFDREPAIARVCVVQALSAGPRALEYREGVLGRLAGVLDEGRGESARGGECTPLVAEALVGAAFGIVYARLLRRESRPLVDLVGELMGLIVLPYLGPGWRGASSGVSGAIPAAASNGAGALGGAGVLRKGPVGSGGDLSALAELPMRLTYRTVRVLECVAEHPGVSNRVVSESAGVSDQGQISKFSRAWKPRLFLNSGEGHAKGEPNAWALTPLGREVTGAVEYERP